MVSRIFSEHNATRLEINYIKKKTAKTSNTWKINNILQNNQEITEEIKSKNLKQPNLHLKQLEKEEQTKPKVSRRK